MIQPMTQDPAPGKCLLAFCGDVITFTLALPRAQTGAAWIRTNIGHVKTIWRQIVEEVELGKPPLATDWYDIPMQRLDDTRFRICLPLSEVGHFEAKCFFLKAGEANPVWPEGHNTVINVEPADTCCANIIYNAFVRQFGPNKGGAGQLSPDESEFARRLDQIGYAVIPPSGKFRDLIKELDFIIGTLGCRLIQLLPIHPTPTTYARMGRFGSPYAALSFTAVDPALAEFDPRATPLEQFIELIDAVHQRRAKLILDIAINHTGWAASLHETHPQWLARDPQGRIEVPGAWGVLWEDLTKLDYSRKDLWRYMADVFLTWCRRGVDGFRCDAGYMIPLAAWRYIVGKVRPQYPDVIFLLEGLGGKLSVTRQLLSDSNLNWCYSELFQNYDRGQIEHYLPVALAISEAEGLTVHFAETHDNPRLAARSQVYAAMRTALCALLSPCGAFGFANGVEWYATEKIDVHGAASLNWGSSHNQVRQIRTLNLILKKHPTFHPGAELKLVQQGAGNHLALLRHHAATGKKLLVLANLDDAQPTRTSWKPASIGISTTRWVDLLTQAHVTATVADDGHTIDLRPGQVLCLSPQTEDLALLTNDHQSLPKRIEQQRLRAKALQVFSFFHGTGHLGDFDPDGASEILQQDPLALCAGLNPAGDGPRVVTWRWPVDARREVMIPPDHLLLVRADRAFRARISSSDHTLACEDSLPMTDGSHMALLIPPVPEGCEHWSLHLSLYSSDGCRHFQGPLLPLPTAQAPRISYRIAHQQVESGHPIYLVTNGCGAMLRAPVRWAALTSRYDGLLAANLSPEFPEDRWIMLSRCRGWVVFQGYYQELEAGCLDTFMLDDLSRGVWNFHIPSGQGQHIRLTVTAEMIPGKNSVRIMFFRQPATGQPARLADSKPVQLILRPDIENRTFHGTTKAYQGPEFQWPQAVSSRADGFSFAPDRDHCLEVNVSEGRFVREPEWLYMVHRPLEAQRGLDPDSDLFSPGYFSAQLTGGATLHLTAAVAAGCGCDSRSLPPARVELTSGPSELRVEDALVRSLTAYVVNRGQLKSVIAGYPWFLDWGRDALIFVRGLIAAGQVETARAVLLQFARFEEHGTLPNVIAGSRAGNRDTSDAPLWLLVASEELMRVDGNAELLDVAIGARNLRQILLSIGNAFVSGTPNGIRMDPQSGLIFSPAHFTWMDTNFPAGTPRQGYAIEIQALWHRALQLLGQIDPTPAKSSWEDLSREVQNAIKTYFWREQQGYLCDCLHGQSGQPASEAQPDDALRPNQLLAITLGAISDTATCRKILAACQELIVPGAVRSLADRPLQYPLPIVHNNQVLNDPHQPYQGRYFGDEDTQRKPAYHNGTAWTWLFPSFCEAWAMSYGPPAKPTARAWLASGLRLTTQGCLGHVPEILDGDYPHTARGCDAQAWGVSELLRVWLMLSEEPGTVARHRLDS
jgi:starch synthase (maltosyl-transferring)